jgi:hypothetical protein
VQARSSRQRSGNGDSGGKERTAIHQIFLSFQPSAAAG